MPKANGAAPRIKRREAWVELPDEYEGFKFLVWVNAPTKLWQELGSGDEARGLEAMRKLMLDHNGWLDFDGEPYPPASEPAFWEEIPTELAACMLVAAQVEMQKLPKSLAPKNRR